MSGPFHGVGGGYPEAAAVTVDTIKGLPRADAGADIVYPGERSAATATTQTTAGIPVAATVWNELRAAAGRLGVTPPTPAHGG